MKFKKGDRVYHRKNGVRDSVVIVNVDEATQTYTVMLWDEPPEVNEPMEMSMDEVESMGCLYANGVEFMLRLLDE